MSERYSFIRVEKACSGFPVGRGCVLLGVSPSGFYAWRDRPASATSNRRAEVTVLAAKAHAASDGTNGYRRVHRDLVADGVACSWQLVRRVLREAGPRRRAAAGLPCHDAAGRGGAGRARPDLP